MAKNKPYTVCFGHVHWTVEKESRREGIFCDSVYLCVRLFFIYSFFSSYPFFSAEEEEEEEWERKTWLERRDPIFSVVVVVVVVITVLQRTWEIGECENANWTKENSNECLLDCFYSSFFFESLLLPFLSMSCSNDARSDAIDLEYCHLVFHFVPFLGKEK